MHLPIGLTQSDAVFRETAPRHALDRRPGTTGAGSPLRCGTCMRQQPAVAGSLGTSTRCDCHRPDRVHLSCRRTVDTAAVPAGTRRPPAGRRIQTPAWPHEPIALQPAALRRSPPPREPTVKPERPRVSLTSTYSRFRRRCVDPVIPRRAPGHCLRYEAERRGGQDWCRWQAGQGRAAEGDAGRASARDRATASPQSARPRERARVAPPATSRPARHASDRSSAGGSAQSHRRRTRARGACQLPPHSRVGGRQLQRRRPSPGLWDAARRRQRDVRQADGVARPRGEESRLQARGSTTICRRESGSRSGAALIPTVAKALGPETIQSTVPAVPVPAGNAGAQSQIDIAARVTVQALSRPDPPGHRAGSRVERR